MNKVLLEDVCYILDNKRVPITECDRKKGPYPYYGANGVQDYVDDYIFDDELVLLAEDGGNFGSKEKPIAYRVSGKCWVNNHAHVLKPKENINVNYLCYSLMFYDVSGFVNGATRQKLTQSNMRQMLIPFCSLAEQQRIADELDKVSGLIEKRQKQLEKLDLLIKSRFVEMFGDPINNTKKLCLVKLNELGEWSSGGTPSRNIAKYFLGDIDWYSAGELKELFLTGSVEKITYEAIDNSSAKLFPQGSMLIGMYDTAAFKMGILKKASASNQACACIIPNNKISIIWLYYVLQEMKAYFLLNRRGIRQKNLNLGMIKNFVIPLAGKELQNQFADFVEKVEQNKSNIKNSLDKLITLKKALMQKYFG